MEAKRIEIVALLRASHKKSDIAKLHNLSHMTVNRGDIFSPFEATTPSIITETGCLVMNTTDFKDILTKAYNMIILFIHNRIDGETFFI